MSKKPLLKCKVGKSMRNLILLTNEFPYGNWEPYLETEVKYYTPFDRVHICSLQTRKEHMKTRRDIELKNVGYCLVKYAPQYVYFFYSIWVLLDQNFYREIFRLISQKKFTIKKLVKLAIFISRSHYEVGIILKYLKDQKILLSDESSNGVLYSYRFEYQPYVGILLRKYLPGYKVVSRAHRFDLYEEERDVSYIPMRNYILEQLDRIVLIANDGKNYLVKNYPEYKDKLSVYRLGTLDHGIRETSCPNGIINIVSCSTVYSVKRIDLIVKALSDIQEIQVNWTHYGDGKDLRAVKALCKEVLPPNIHCEFRGHVDNKKVLEDYKTKPYHVFLNVSQSEGIPVSIMEVLSFGIPCIATDVGGTREIIENRKNGILLEKNFDVKQLASLVVWFSRMSETEYQSFRSNARKSWFEKYNADENYRLFVNSLMSDEW